MRISIPIDRWDPNRGGAERYLARLSAELGARGHEVTVLCCEALAEQPGSSGARIEALPVPHFPRWLRELRFAQAAVRAHRASGRDVLFQVRHALQADVYQPHGGSLLASRRAQGLALPAWRRWARDLAAALRPSHHVLRSLDRAVFQSGRRPVVLSVSGKVEEDFRRTYPEIDFRFERLPNPVDTEHFHDRDREVCRAALRAQYGFLARDRVALFAAHHFGPKGLHCALSALALDGDWRLVVAGRDETKPFQRFAARLGVLDRVRFAGPVGDLRAFHAAADAFVLPTYYDACSLGVLESLACGTPPITTRLNGASELLVHGRNGFVLDRPDDPARLAQALGEAASRPGIREACRQAASELSWERHVERLEKILFQVTGSKLGCA